MFALTAALPHACLQLQLVNCLQSCHCITSAVTQQLGVLYYQTLSLDGRQFNLIHTPSDNACMRSSILMCSTCVILRQCNMQLTVVCLQMMTPFQLANIVVQTYPWVPDTGALLNQLAEDEGQPSAIELLGFGEGSISGELDVKMAPQMQNSDLPWVPNVKQEESAIV